MSASAETLARSGREPAIEGKFVDVRESIKKRRRSRVDTSRREFSSSNESWAAWAGSELRNFFLLELAART